MKIGIIGTGSIGSLLVCQFTKAGHEVKMVNSSGLEKLKPLAKETGAKPVELADVVKNVDVIVLSIPFGKVANLPKDLFMNVAPEIPIIDTCNYYPVRDGNVKEVDDGMIESLWVSKNIGRPVVKAYQAIMAGPLASTGRPKGSADRIALPVSSNNKHDFQIVSSLINDSGYDVFDGGTLEESWKFQPGGAGYCTDLPLNLFPEAVNLTKKEDLPKKRDEVFDWFMKHTDTDWILGLNNNRKVFGAPKRPL
jgi:predicted dinucleotide-binding enzyme